jgi:hypothetical protein
MKGSTGKCENERFTVGSDSEMLARYLISRPRSKLNMITTQ